MTKELENIINEIENLSKRCQLGVDVEEEREYIRDLPELYSEIQELTKNLSQLQIKDTEKIMETLVDLHIRLGNYCNRIEEVDELVKKAMYCYATDEDYENNRV
jgi:primase-polymerase (primpol)-like protein